MKIQFTRITSSQGALAKRMSLDADGQLQKTAAAQLFRGRYQVETVNHLTDFIPLLESATPDTAFTYGVPDHPAGDIVRDDDRHLHPSAIARTRGFFSWPTGPGILMIDDDSGQDVGNFGEFLWETVPVLDGVEMIVRPSSSSWIKNTETDEWVCTQGHRRAYVLVSDAKRIQEVGKLIESYLWLAGYGHYTVSSSGALLKRCLVDTSVWQPERLDFVGGAVCVPPLAQEKLRAELIEGHQTWVNTKYLPKLSGRDLTRIDTVDREARRAVEERRQAVREAYVADQITKLADRGVTAESAEAIILAAIEEQVLCGDFVLTLQDGTKITVADMLAEPEKFNGKRCHDPLEPEYRNDPRVAYISLTNGGAPYIHSHAHGGCRYLLKKPAKIIQITSGNASNATDQIARHLAKEGILYERGQVIVTVQSDGQTREASAATVKYQAGSHCAFRRFDNRSETLRPTDLPDSVAQQVLTRAGYGVFPRLSGVITAPTMTPEGRIIAKPGFDQDTGLLFIANGETSPLSIEARANKETLQKAFDQLWFPFKDFPFDSDESRSAMLAAILTAVVRPCLSTAPGFGFDAPTAGSGKTKLAQCIAALATGHSEALMPPPSDDEETRKKISTAVLASKQVMIFDNVEAQLKSPVLAAFLTAPMWSDRMLGGNTKIEAENRILLLLTGNNLAPVGDIVRRLLIVRIDPQLEARDVWQREFALEPLDYVIRNRQRMVASALTILSQFVAAGMQRHGAGRLASVEQWDDLIRQCVIWLGEQGIGNLVDPVKRLNETAANDPEVARLSMLTHTWFQRFGEAPQALKDIAHCGQLYESLKEVAQDRRGEISTKMLAAYVAKRVGKIVDGRRFEKVKGRANTWRWRVVLVTDGAGGFGGFGGLVLAHPANNINSSSDNFGGAAETDPPKPPNPPSADEPAEPDEAEQPLAGAGT